MLRITFYAHASFRLETPDVAVITDPYTPGPKGAGFDPIDEAADVVVMSSSTDRFHSDPSHIWGEPRVVDALRDVPPEGLNVRDVAIRAFPAHESHVFDFGRDPDANAMSLLEIGGIRVLHMGDIGNPLSSAQLDALGGQVDVMLALAGAHATIALQDLDAAITAIQPRIVIPMHYRHPRGTLTRIEPVDSFLARHGNERIVRGGGSTITVDENRLREPPSVVVLDQSR